MIKKLDLDIESIVKQSFLEAKKKHGLIVEQEQTTVKESDPEIEFDPAKHMPEIAIKPNKWAKYDSVESAELKAIVDSLNPSGGDGFSRFNSCITKLNTVLGITPGSSGIPIAVDSEKSNVNQLYSSIMLRGIISSIIFNQSPQSAGKIFEALAAKMVNGSVGDDTKGDIQDLLDEAGNYISLKVIDRSTEVKGSKYNLAKGIVEAQKAGKWLGYLVLIKDKRNNPFSFKTISFKLNTDNYFYFLANGQPLTQQLLNSLINDIAKESDGKSIQFRSAKPVKTNESLRLFENIEQESNIDAYGDTFRKYAQNILGVQVTADEKKSIKALDDAINTKFVSLVNKSLPDKNDVDQQKFYQNFLPVILDPRLQNKTASQPINVKSFIELTKQISRLKNLSEEDLATTIGPNKRDVLYKIIKNNLPELNKFINDIQNIYYSTREKPSEDGAETRARTKVANMLAKKQTEIEPGAEYSDEQKAEIEKRKQEEIDVKNMIEDFWNGISSGRYIRKTRTTTVKEATGGDSDAGSDSDSQFYLSVSYVMQLAKSLPNAEFNDSYPDVIIDGNVMFASARENVDLLKKWIEPIYKNFFYLDRGLKKYFIRDKPDGLSEAEKSTESLKNEIQKVPKAETGEYVSAKELKENKNKPLTKDWSVLMLEELLK